MFGLVEHIKSEYLSGMFWGQTHVATQKKKKKKKSLFLTLMPMLLP